MNSPTVREYDTFQQAYDFLNQRLFGNVLPPVLITLQRKSHSYGYFHAENFKAREGQDAIDELAMNPDGFAGRTDREILSTLTHEMAHVWQQRCGQPPRRCYHDRQWAAKMKEIGLQPSSTGAPGGKETGQKMTHYIISGGPFDQTSEQLERTGFRLNWQSIAVNGDGGSSTNKNKVKYTCPECELNAWAKPGAHLSCGDCELRMRDERERETGDYVLTMTDAG